MGDRAQVLVEDNGVYLYTHWGSDTLLQDLKKWIFLARPRWDDPEYFARVIFSNMIADNLEGTTGFGIGTSKHGDIELLVTFNCKKGTVTVKEMYEDNEVFYKSFNNFIDNN